MLHDSQGSLVFWYQKSRQKFNGVILNGGTRCRWGRLNAGAVSENSWLSMWSVVSLVRLQVYDTEHPPYLFAARSLWWITLNEFVSDSWSLFTDYIKVHSVCSPVCLSLCMFVSALEPIFLRIWMKCELHIGTRPDLVHSLACSKEHSRADNFMPMYSIGCFAPGRV